MSLLPSTLPVFVPEGRDSVEEHAAIERATGKRYAYHRGRSLSVDAMVRGDFRHALLASGTGAAVAWSITTEVGLDASVWLPRLAVGFRMADVYRG